MADSDHSMNCACVTRRATLLGGVAAIGSGWQSASQLLPVSPAVALFHSDALTAHSDPVISLWRQWQTTHLRIQQLSERLQDLEVELAERFDSFGTIVPVPGSALACVYSLQDLHWLFGDRGDMAGALSTAERELAAKPVNSNGVLEDLGYSSTMAAEQAAFTEAKASLDQMASTQATSLAGVVAKLDAVARWGEAWNERPREFPWPHIRSAHADLVAIGQRLQPGAIFPGVHG
ncbi:hypothetical protein D5400_20545 [Georhizobium profundi]|uniref:Uncharacterized protein n=1 Tax=Georhizobium profundi TaxID=2341112 RepID=A0A3S9B8X6_9HYPH|nr:hypothetical protein [Georhizobium profundi]AZN73359.1 hypothetical protein D5400_20545 [Georhizobium profundi]